MNYPQPRACMCTTPAPMHHDALSRHGATLTMSMHGANPNAPPYPIPTTGIIQAQARACCTGACWLLTCMQQQTLARPSSRHLFTLHSYRPCCTSFYCGKLHHIGVQVKRAPEMETAMFVGEVLSVGLLLLSRIMSAYRPPLGAALVQTDHAAVAIIVLLKDGRTRRCVNHALILLFVHT